MEKYVNSLVDLIVNYSIKVQQKEKILIRCIGENNAFIQKLVEKIRDIGAFPLVLFEPNNIQKAIQNGIDKDYADFLFESYSNMFTNADAYINVIYDEEDKFENLKKVTIEDLQIFKKYYYGPLQNIRLKNTRWIGLRIPTQKMARHCGVSYEQLVELFYKASIVDYQELEKKYQKLTDLIAKTEQINIVTSDTNLTLNKKGIGAKGLFAQNNFPDGEIATAPLKYQVNGNIKFNTSCYYNDFLFENIELEFKGGKVIKFNSNNNAELEKILNLDEGASYLGEFAVGVNPEFTKHSGIILFDEKMDASIHIALGQAHEFANNSNKSILHWDLVKVMSKSYSGGKILFDNQLVFEDGVWLV